MDVSARIRDIIDDRDMTQKELALRLDIRYTTLNNYLKKYNRVPLEVLRSIAVELNVTTDYLFDLAKSPERSLPLNNTERKLVENFRSLSKPQKELILQNIIFSQTQTRHAKPPVGAAKGRPYRGPET